MDGLPRLDSHTVSPGKTTINYFACIQNLNIEFIPPPRGWGESDTSLFSDGGSTKYLSLEKMVLALCIFAYSMLEYSLGGKKKGI